MKLDKRVSTILSFLVLVSITLLFSPAYGAMNSYCVTPPFLSQNIPPNVVIVLDNSLSMCSQAYAGSYNPNQFANYQYYGYFDGSKNYQYTGNGRWEVTTLPMSDGTSANPIANGSLLNWASMRRIEVAKKLLIGGKGNPRSWNGSVSVKLNAELQCNSSWDFQKDFDSTGTNLIYPFEGSYRFKRQRGDDLYITPTGSGTTFITYPSDDISAPSGWSEYPASGPLTVHDKVDETTPDDDSTYVENSDTTDPVILDYQYNQSRPAASSLQITVKIRAKRSSGNSSRNIAAVIRVDGVDYESQSSSLSSSYSEYSFTWTRKPGTNAPWTWNDIKGPSVAGHLEGFGFKATGNYTSKYPRITRVYLDISIPTPSGGPYNTIVDMGEEDATGIIDTLSEEVRFGLALYNSNDEGAKIEEYVDFGATTDMINKIGDLVPSTYTPLAESLYEMVRYYRQDAPKYAHSPADYKTGVNTQYDPYYYMYQKLDPSQENKYVPCAKSYVLLLTDGESTRDTNIPGTIGESECSLNNIKGCSAGYRFAGTPVGKTYSSEGTDYLADVAFWARTNDMRSDMLGMQNVFLYTVYLFGSGSTLLKDAAINGGFDDLDMDVPARPDCDTNPAECYKDSNGNGIVEHDKGICGPKVACTSDADCTSPGTACQDDGFCSLVVCTSDSDCTAPGTSCIFDNPLTYYEGEDGYALQTAVPDVTRLKISDIAVVMAV